MKEKARETRIRVLTCDEVEERIRTLFKQERYVLERARGLEAQADSLYRDAARLNDKIVALYELLEKE